MERRHLLKRVFGTVLAVLVVWHEDLLDYLYPETPPQLPTIHGTANVTLEPLTAGPYTLAAETGSFTLTGGAASMRVSGA